MKHLPILLVATILASCQTTETAPAASSTPAIAFAQAACAGCHAVEPGWQSPNRNAPTFLAIANRRGLTSNSLATWLRDAHNYPEAMDFDLTDEKVAELSNYILSLRDENYEPPIN